jgi:uncharacterized membrane protein HdeD (DUF308 family)
MTAYAVDTDVDAREDLRSFRQAWWLFLIAGVFWIWLGFMVLNVDATTIGLISVLVGVLLIFAGAEELTNMVVMSQWRWLHGVLGVIFIGGGIFAFAYPGQTFGTLALFVGWFLLIRGTFEICVSIATHGARLWWLGLISGVVQVGVAIWAVGYPGRSAALLVLWVGIAAIMRGVSDLAMGFQVRRLGKEVA